MVPMLGGYTVLVCYIHATLLHLWLVTVIRQHVPWGVINRSATTKEQRAGRGNSSVLSEHPVRMVSSL